MARQIQTRRRPRADLAGHRSSRRGPAALLQRQEPDLRQSQHDRGDHRRGAAQLPRGQSESEVPPRAATQQVALTVAVDGCFGYGVSTIGKSPDVNDCPVAVSEDLVDHGGSVVVVRIGSGLVDLECRGDSCWRDHRLRYGCSGTLRHQTPIPALHVLAGACVVRGHLAPVPAEQST